MKVTMLGTSGAGKTTFMCGMYESLGLREISDFSITPSSAGFTDAVKVQGNFEAFSFENLNFQFPEGTEHTTPWNFSLYHRNKDEVSSFEWIDYRGGCIDELYSASGEGTDSNDLLNHVALSNGLLVFCDAVALVKYKPKEAARRTGARNILKLLKLFSQNFPYNTLSITVVITKADSDLIPEEYSANNFEGLTSVASGLYSDLRKLCEYNDGRWRAGVVPVGAIGIGNVASTFKQRESPNTPHQVTTQIKEDPEPFNIEHPLFYTIGNVLEFMEWRARRDIAANRHEAERALAESGFLRDVWSKMTGETNPRDIANEYLRKCRETQASLFEFRPFIDPLVKAARKKVRPV